MEKEEGFRKIQQLLPDIHQYFDTKKIPLSFDENKQMILKQVYERFVVPGAIFAGFNCPPCVTSVFEMIDSFYLREFSKYEQQLNQHNQQNKPELDMVKEKTTTLATKEIKPKYKGRNNIK